MNICIRTGTHRYSLPGIYASWVLMIYVMGKENPSVLRGTVKSYTQEGGIKRNDLMLFTVIAPSQKNIYCFCSDYCLNTFNKSTWIESL